MIETIYLLYTLINHLQIHEEKPIYIDLCLELFEMNFENGQFIKPKIIAIFSD